MRKNDNENTREFARLLKADFFRVSKQKSLIVGFVLMLAITLFMYIMLWAAANLLSQVALTATEADGVPDGITGAVDILIRSLLAGFSDTASLSLFMAIIAGIFIGGEFKNGSIRMLVARGVNRTRIYLSKLLTLAAIMVAYMVALIIFSGILTAIGGYGTNGFSANDFAILVRNFALQFLSQLSMLSIGVMLGFLTRSKSGAIWSMIGVLMLLDVLFGAVYAVAVFGVNTDWIMFMPTQQLAVASSTTKLTALQAVAATVMPVVYAGISTLLGILSFNKRDIK